MKEERAVRLRRVRQDHEVLHRSGEPSRHGRVRSRLLSIGAGVPGRYHLVVSERGHKARALVVVSP